MEGPDEIIHQSVRLRIMAALAALPRGEALDFIRLRAVLQTTDGNLGAHLATLEKARYVAVEKHFVARKPRTQITLSPEGRRAYARHVAFLRTVIDGAERLEAAQ